MKKKGTALILSLFLFAALSVPVLAARGDVYDQAGLFNGIEADQLLGKAEELSEKWERDFVVVTASDTEGKSAREYADDFYDEKGYGTTGKNSGVLFLVDMEHREMYVSTFGDMQLYITDKRLEDILDAGYEEASQGDYYGCVSNMMAGVNSCLAGGVPDGQYTYDEETGKLVKVRQITWWEGLLAAAAALLTGGGSMLVIRRKHRLKDNLYQYPFRTRGKVELTQKEDQFKNQFVTTRRIPKKTSGGSGGGSGGRTTVHTSSSGRSHGGGGRSF